MSEDASKYLCSREESSQVLIRTDLTSIPDSCEVCVFHSGVCFFHRMKLFSDINTCPMILVKKED